MKVVTPIVELSLFAQLYRDSTARKRRKRKRGISRRRIGSFDRYVGLRIDLALRQIHKSQSMGLLLSAAEIPTIVKSLQSLRAHFVDIGVPGAGEVLLGQTQSALIAAGKSLALLMERLDGLTHQPPGALDALHSAATDAVDTCLGPQSGLKSDHAMAMARLAVALGTVRDPNFAADLEPISITTDVISSLICDYEI